MLPSTLELIKKSFDLYKKNKFTLLKYSLLLAVPVLLTVIFRIFLTIRFGDNMTYFQMAGAAVVIFVFYLLTLWVTITLIRILSNLYNKNDISSIVKELKSSKRFIFPSLVAIILSALCVIGGLALFIIPGFIFSVWFFFSVYSVILDNKRGPNALHMSKFLVKGRWWDVFWLLFSTTFIILGSTMILESLLSFMFTLIAEAAGEKTMVILTLNILGFLFSFVLSVFVIPLSAAIPTILYNELKKLKNL